MRSCVEKSIQPAVVRLSRFLGAHIAPLVLIGVGIAAVVEILLKVRCDWPWSDLLGALSLTISVPGFSLAFFELHQARKYLRRRQIADAIYELQQLASAIDKAGRDGEGEEGVDQLRVLLTRWSDLATKIIDLIEGFVADPLEIVAQLRDSTEEARDMNIKNSEELPGALRDQTRALRANFNQLAARELPEMREILLYYDRESNDQ